MENKNYVVIGLDKYDQLIKDDLVQSMLIDEKCREIAGLSLKLSNVESSVVSVMANHLIENESYHINKLLDEYNEYNYDLAYKSVSKMFNGFCDHLVDRAIELAKNIIQSAKDSI